MRRPFAGHALLVGFVLATSFAAPGDEARAAAPILYKQPFYQSPVRAEPDDLLFLAGYGFAAGDVVVYKRLTDTTLPLEPQRPATVPSVSTADLGTAPVVHYLNVPDSLTVRLPTVILSGRTYALWVANTAGEWSTGVRINDARPLWVSPEVSYTKAAPANLPRQIKVVGRNLEPLPGQSTRVKLVGPQQTYTLTAANDNDPTTAIERYVARVSLPNVVKVGTYSIQVSRDGTSWVSLDGQQLTILADPPSKPVFNVGSFGCSPNDSGDDTACVVAAINAAGSNGVVSFGNGRWDLGLIANQAPDVNHGIVVPMGVSLTGTGTATTRVVRNTNWNGRVVFTMQGSNTVSKIRFEDAQAYPPTPLPWDPYFALGKLPWWATPSDPHVIDQVIFTQNIFDKPANAIGAGGFPIKHLYVTSNEIGAFWVGLSPNSIGLKDIKFHIDDSVVWNNVFKPGDYYDCSVTQGAMAGAWGASRHVDYSGNIADGHSFDYTRDPTHAHPGWRAGFFFNLGGNHDMLLVSQNTATCTGDKDGEAEAFSFDWHPNKFARNDPEGVLGATTNTVTIPGPLNETVPADFYSEHWAVIVDGKGVGQVRRVVSYTAPDASTVTFTVTPAWDVVPQSGSSKATVGREYWQLDVIDNTADIRGCAKTNTNFPWSGKIFLAGMTADSAVEGNHQYEADGIQLAPGYVVYDPASPSTTPQHIMDYFVEVRGNSVDNEYDYNSNFDWGGIQVWYGTSQGVTGPVLAYGLSVARNTVRHADGLRGGAITLANGYYSPVNPYAFKNILIQHNDISDMVAPNATDFTRNCPPGGPFGDSRNTQTGINVHDSWSWFTVLYANTFQNVLNPVRDNGTCTVDASNPPPPACPATHACPFTLCLDPEGGSSQCARGVGSCSSADTGSAMCETLCCPPGQTIHVVTCPCTCLGSGCGTQVTLACE